MTIIKLILAILLPVCLLPMPYGYYTIVRFISMALFAFFAYTYYEKKVMPLVFTFGVLSLLFQPFIKVALGRNVWYLVDVFVAIYLIFLWTKERKNNYNSSYQD